MKKMLKMAAVALIALLFIYPSFAWAGPREKIIVGGKTFTEQFLLARMLTLMLRAEGYEVEERINVPTGKLRKLLIDKEVDVYWEYTGAGYKAHLRQKDPEIFVNPEKIYNKVKELDRKNGIIWLAKAPLNNTYALAMKKDKPGAYKVRKLSDLAARMNRGEKIFFGISNTFYNRPDGFKKLIAHYKFSVPKAFIKYTNNALVYGALDRGQVEAGVVFATDSRIRQSNLIVLKDDLAFFPVYNPAPTILAETLKRYPKIKEIAGKIAPLLDDSTMIWLNYQVDVEKKKTGQVARDWLQKAELLK